MARNGSGTMSITYSFSSGSTIQSSQVNANFTDVASEITNSLARDGQSAMTGQLKAAAGSASVPSITFDTDRDTGIYRKTGDTMGLVSGGTEVATVGPTGIVDANSVVLSGIPSGTMLMFCSTTAPSGWVRCNGRTIGNASSGATERANADTSALYTLLWTAYDNTVCPVSGGRGASAAADYAANKTLGLPDLRGRALFGLDDMGNSAAGRLGTIITTPTTNGASGGTETHTLTTSQIPSHTHGAGTLALSTDPGHTHNIFTSTGANNTGQGISGNDNNTNGPTNTGSVATGGSHTHTISGSTGSAGTGGAHTNMPPAFLGTFIIKL